MTDLVNLIAFWKAILLTHGWAMDVTTNNMVEFTINALEELKKLKGE